MFTIFFFKENATLIVFEYNMISIFHHWGDFSKQNHYENCEHIFLYEDSPSSISIPSFNGIESHLRTYELLHKPAY